MKTTHLVAILVSCAAVALLAADASAMYHPTMGRFMQRDPIGYADEMNLYEYVRSGPLSGSDPFGTKWWNPLTWFDEELSCCGTKKYDPEKACCADPEKSEVVSTCDPPEGFEVIGDVVAEENRPGASASEKVERQIGRSTGAMHVNVYYNKSEIRQGFFGGVTTDAKVGPDKGGWALKRVEKGALRWGSSAGLECRCATAEMIVDCVRSAPAPRSKDGVDDEFNSILNNCQQDVQHAIEGCCLRGYRAKPLPPNEWYYMTDEERRALEDIKARVQMDPANFFD